MKRYLLLVVFGIIAGLMTTFAQYPPTGDPSKPNAVTVTTSNKLNVRTGPNKQAGIVDQIRPGETAYVVDVDDYGNGWVKVKTERASGFVSTSYIKGLNGDYYQYVHNYNSGSQPDDNGNRSGFGNKFASATGSIVAVLGAFLQWLLGLPVWVLIIFAVMLIGGEVIAIRWLKEEYGNSYYREKPGTLYAFIVPLFLIVMAILPMWSVGASYGRVGSLVWLILLMCFLPLLINTCWILEENGKVNKRKKRSDCSDYAVGKTISIITILLAAYPLTMSFYTLTDRLLRNTLGIPDTFVALVITMVAMTALTYGLIFGLMKLIEYTLQPLHNFSVMVLVTGFFFILAMAEKDLINHFFGFYYVLALLGWLFNCVLLLSFYKSLRCLRCANCHRFEGYISDTTDRGYSIETSDSWDNISDSSIRSSRTVRNAQALNRTYTTMHNWTDHYSCDFCGHQWSMLESEAVASETHTIKKRWEEYD